MANAQQPVTVDMNQIGSKLRHLIQERTAPDSLELNTALTITVSHPVNMHHLMSMATDNRDTADASPIHSDAKKFNY